MPPAARRPDAPGMITATEEFWDFDRASYDDELDAWRAAHGRSRRHRLAPRDPDTPHRREAAIRRRFAPCAPERQDADRPVGPSEPTGDGSTVARERGAQHRPVRRDPSAVRRPVRDDDPDRHGRRRVDAAGSSRARSRPGSRDGPCGRPCRRSSLTSAMSVFSSMTSRARRRGMPGEDVDHAALAVDRERDLRLHQPPGQRAEMPARPARGAPSAWRSAAGPGRRLASAAAARCGRRAPAQPPGSSRR